MVLANQRGSYVSYKYGITIQSFCSIPPQTLQLRLQCRFIQVGLAVHSFLAAQI